MDIVEPILAIAEKLYALCGEVKANKMRCKRLAVRVAALMELVKAIKKREFGQNPENVKKGLEELRITLDSAQKLIKNYACSNYLKRIVRAYDQGDGFGSLNDRLNEAAQMLSLALQLDQRDTLLEGFRETRLAQDEEDYKADRIELEQLLQSLAEETKGTKETVDAMSEIVTSTNNDVKDLKALLKSIQKPCIRQQDTREIKAEELTYDQPKVPIMKSASSEVYKGEFIKFTVAIKRYTYALSTTPSQVRSTFHKEVETLRRFESPNILRMFGICVQDENGPNPNYLIVMEYCEKGSLRQVLDSQCNLPWRRKAHMSLDAANGLYRLHQSEQKFKVHGCINSSKFLVDAGYRVKLGGFELAKTETSLKKSKDIKNSMLCYNSPEQLENINRPYSKECEIYSFGIVLWEIATRKIPFKDCSSHKEVYHKMCKDKTIEPLPDDCPVQLGELIDTCRTYDSFNRPTAGVLVDKLRKVVEQLEED